VSGPNEEQLRERWARDADIARGLGETYMPSRGDLEDLAYAQMADAEYGRDRCPHCECRLTVTVTEEWVDEYDAYRMVERACPNPGCGFRDEQMQSAPMGPEDCWGPVSRWEREAAERSRERGVRPAPREEIL
jgi:hypothetical protein